ncbi:DNA-binding transcriptional regulator AsnC [Glutamicibacter creatinolyticus]|uniref:DNA-binding transcriptional regulator AsnC n=1 Tax=Glutamicibacter creatinolyticus TaxID=162496 RepID=A0A5B7WUE0_9MICC|nr:DNA-binding transcriptional regulator AsnC [Glutamicibacter creatinolyticus]TLK49139.1 AsnC family transcriptional regulator [Glutamicibacter sp. V16R2B1]
MSYKVHATDLEIVDALQASPRATWASVGKALGLSEVTVARRWNRLHTLGLAWTSIALHPSQSYGVVVEIRCELDRLEHLLNQLNQHPQIFTVGQTTGEYNLFCIIGSTNVNGVIHTIHERLPDLTKTSQVKFSIFWQITGGVDWRQGILPAGDESHLRVHSEGHTTRRFPPLSKKDRRLFLALARDARKPLADLAAELSLSTEIVRRRLFQLQASNEITYRCDVARPSFDLPLGLFVLVRTPSLDSERIARDLGAWKETRFCAAVVSSTNIVWIAGLHDLPDVGTMIDRLTTTFPEIEVADQRVITRMTKIYGRLLDTTGKSRGCVPFDPWED